uniref:Uncharacterized protein n=1 Tax=Hordeum vulgare subsp. vulgare TaxID=112509 RepID=A0A8I6XTS5_HORVV
MREGRPSPRTTTTPLVAVTRDSHHNGRFLLRSSPNEASNPTRLKPPLPHCRHGHSYSPTPTPLGRLLLPVASSAERNTGFWSPRRIGFRPRRRPTSHHHHHRRSRGHLPDARAEIRGLDAIGREISRGNLILQRVLESLPHQIALRL